MLKYVNPKLFVTVKVTDSQENDRDIQVKFRINIDIDNQEVPKPPIRYKALDVIGGTMMQFAQDSAFFIKLGNFETDKDIFPLDRYDLKVKANNVTLDDNGNLFMAEDPFKSE